jgi:hypothetical protein
VKLSSRDGASIEIRPIGYQFPLNPQAKVGADWDNNWLVVGGAVTTGGQQWTFVDPCLTTWEAPQISTWLRRVADGSLPSTTDWSEDWSEDASLLYFTEPNLALSLQSRTDEHACLRVHLSLEALPPWRQGADRPNIYDYFLRLDLSVKDLAAAAEQWDNDCHPFPAR